VLTKTGDGTLILTGDNNYSRGNIITGGPIGRTVIEDGTVVMGSVNALGNLLQNSTAGTVEIDSAGTLNVAANTFDYTRITASSTGAVTANGGTLYLDSNANLNNITLTGNITLNTGTGTATLSTSNSHTAGTIIPNTAILNNAGALGSSGNIVIAGGTLVFTAVNTTDYSARIYSDQSGDACNVNTNGQTVTFASTLPALNLVKQGAGTLVLTANNTNLFLLDIDGGLVQFSSLNNLGLVSGNPNHYPPCVVTLNGGGLQWASGSTTDASSEVVLGANGGTFDTNGNTVVFANPLGGSGSLTKTGTGFLRLTTQNTYTGGTTINSGVLALACPTSTHGAIGTAGAQITINSGNINLETDNALAGTSPYTDIVLTINSTGLLSTVNNTTQLPAVVMNGGSIETAAGGNSSVGNYIFTDGLSTPGTGKLSRIFGGYIVLPSAVTVGTGDSLQISSIIMGGNSLVKQGPGALVLTAANTYTGNTTVNAGLIEFNSASALGAATNTITLNGGGLRWATGTSTDISSRFAALGSSGGTLDTNGNNVTLGSIITGAGSITKAGNGTLKLTVLNTYTGGTAVNGGILEVAGPGGGIGAITGSLTINSGAEVLTDAIDAFGFSSNSTKVNSVTINGGTLVNAAPGNQGWGIAYALNGGSMSSNGGISSSTAASKFAFGNNTSVTVSPNTTASIAGRVDLRSDGGITNVNFTVGSGATLNVSAAITNSTSAVGLTELGTGTLVLTGANTYTGTTNVTAGTLAVRGSLSGTVNVSSGATLGGDGKIGGLATISDGGHIAPGFSSGALTFQQGLTLSGSANFDFQLGLSVSDLIVVSGGSLTGPASGLINTQPIQRRRLHRRHIQSHQLHQRRRRHYLEWLRLERHPTRHDHPRL